MGGVVITGADIRHDVVIAVQPSARPHVFDHSANMTAAPYPLPVFDFGFFDWYDGIVSANILYVLAVYFLRRNVQLACQLTNQNPAISVCVKASLFTVFLDFDIILLAWFYGFEDFSSAGSPDR